MKFYVVTLSFTNRYCYPFSS